LGERSSSRAKTERKIDYAFGGNAEMIRQCVTREALIFSVATQDEAEIPWAISRSLRSEGK
jgi:hypothetical protein